MLIGDLAAKVAASQSSGCFPGEARRGASVPPPRQFHQRAVLGALAVFIFQGDDDTMPVTRWALLLAAVSALRAQPADPRFDVASVKPNRTDACRGRWDFSTAHGALTAVNAPLLRIVSRAYNLTDDRISGPAWLQSQCYDIRAKAAANVPDRDLMPMLQSLLADRFHLVVRRESEERPVLVLTVSKEGSKLRPYAADVPAPPLGDEPRTLFMARHMRDLCERLGKVAGRPVIDKTGLDGDYLIVLLYFPPLSTNAEPDIFSAVRDQLGLNLEPQRAIVDTLKITAVDKVPTRN